MSDIVDITIPGSKSLTHRCIICAALADGESRISNGLESDDIAVTVKALEACGASINREEPGVYKVVGLGAPTGTRNGENRQALSSNSLNHTAAPLRLDMGESGTSCRLLTAVLAAGQGSFLIDGAAGLRRRPISGLVEALRALGTGVDYTGEAGSLPLLLKAKGFPAAAPGFQVSVNCGRTSQYLSGILLAAPLRGKKTGDEEASSGLRNILLSPFAYFRSKNGTPADDGDFLILNPDCSEPGREDSGPVSWPYVGLTLQAMSYFGVRPRLETLDNSGNWAESTWAAEQDKSDPRPGRVRFLVPAGRYRATDVTVEADWSSASYFLAAGAIGPRPVRIRGLNLESLQGDRRILDILRLMGARVEVAGDSVTVSPCKLKGRDLDLGFCPDIVPTVLALGAHAKGTTVVRNVSHLQFKESDRIMAMVQELRKVGCVTLKLQGDQGGGLAVSPPAGGLRVAEEVDFNAHNDHRIAMALCLLGLPSPAQGGDWSELVRQARPRENQAGSASGKPAHSAPAGFQIRLDSPECVHKSFPGFWEMWRRVIG